MSISVMMMLWHVRMRTCGVGSLGETTKARGNAEPDLSSELLFFGLIWLEDDVFFSGNRRLQEVRFVCVSSRDGLLESHVINLP